jgi:Sec-independent protein translocase protein TatA
MREIKDALKQSRNQMKEIRAELRKTIKSNDLAALETALEQIASMQEQRIELVTKINAILQNMIELVDQN